MPDKMPYAINNDIDKPIVGLPLTCSCGRLWLELDPCDRFMRETEIGKLYCGRCLVQAQLAEGIAGGGAADKG